MKVLQELDEAMTSLWYQAEISDQAKMYWNDEIVPLIVAKLKEKEGSNA